MLCSIHVHLRLLCVWGLAPGWSTTLELLQTQPCPNLLLHLLATTLRHTDHPQKQQQQLTFSGMMSLMICSPAWKCEMQDRVYRACPRAAPRSSARRHTWRRRREGVLAASSSTPWSSPAQDSGTSRKAVQP